MDHYTNTLPPPVEDLPGKKEIVVEPNIDLPTRKIYFFLKRSFDIIFSFLFLACVFSWLFPIISLLILFDSKGPVIFVQRRIGKNGRSFRCFKFRTMIVNDECDEKQAQKNDQRITKVGRFLRQTNLDETPQFINVIAGDMSVIGPRPHMFSDWTRFSFVIPGYKFRSLLRPGITGLAQIKGHHGPTPDYKSIYTRSSCDAQYIRKACFRLDSKIIILTFLKGIKNLFIACFHSRNN
jgi:putative colanic acid biosynthesis UDP-glucose lipid carrier transferase